MKLNMNMNIKFFFILSVFSFPFSLEFSTNTTANLYSPNVAIIGANLGGVSVSHYLNSKFQGKINITIFEKSPVYGGSIKSQENNGNPLELGDTVIYDWFSNIKELLREFKLKLAPFDSHLVLGMFNGDDYFLYSRMNDSIPLMKTKYSDDFLILVTLLKRFQNDFKNIYEIVNKTPKKLLADLLSEAKLDKLLLQRRTDQFLLNLNIKLSFIDEFVRTILFSSNYMNTDMTIYSGLRTVFNFLTRKFKAEEGLLNLIKAMIYNEKYFNKNTFLQLNTKLTKVRYLEEENKYELHFSKEDYKGNTKVNKEKYDKVVFSNFLNKSEIEFENCKENKNFIDNDKIIKVNSYFIIGNLNNFYFSRNIENNLFGAPDLILVNDIKGYNKISQISNICKDCYLNRNYELTGKRKNSLFKITSTKELGKEDFDEFFLKGFTFKQEYTTVENKIKNKVYEAYEDEQEIPDIILDNKGMYYLKAYESLNSNLEYATIFANNIAGLIYEEYNKSEMDYLRFDM